MAVDVRHLRCFLAIAEMGTITRAAAALHITQPALSRTLSQLERHLDTQLVDRSTHHLRLTAAGVAFQLRAAAAVAAVDSVVDPAQLGAWPLRVGHAWSALGRHTTPLIRRWEREHPDVPLQLLRIDDRLAGLADGSVAAAILRDPEPTPALTTELLLTEPRFAVLPSDSPLAGRDRLLLGDLSDQTVSLNPVSGTTRLSLWPAQTRPTSVVEVTNTDDWLAIIASGQAVGVTVAATMEVHPYPGVAYVPLADAPEGVVVLAWTTPMTHPAIPDLVALAHEVVAGADRSS
jgi:DNA-binding transcriptional LysR family regulator